MRIFANTYPDSGIEDAVFNVVEFRPGPHILLRFPFTVGKHIKEILEIPSHFRPEDIVLDVTSQGRNVSVHARHIPWDSDLHLIGVNKDLFLGTFVHAYRPNQAQAPRCELRCSPNDKPVTGPGCIPCEKGGLIFKVCC